MCVVVGCVGSVCGPCACHFRCARSKAERKEGMERERGRKEEGWSHRLEEAIVVEGDGKGGVGQDGGVVVDELCRESRRCVFARRWRDGERGTTREATKKTPGKKRSVRGVAVVMLPFKKTEEEEEGY